MNRLAKVTCLIAVLAGGSLTGESAGQADGQGSLVRRTSQPPSGRTWPPRQLGMPHSTRRIRTPSWRCTRVER